MDLITDSVHRAVERRDADWILSGRISTAEEGEFLAGLEVAIGTVFRKVTDLRAGGRGNTGKRQSAH